jgi:phosphopantothenoylcysteine decarboxylase/phosphopantothenate--cysteine ligase
MGYAIAEEITLRGGQVILISGPVSLKPSHPDIHCISVTSAEEMYNQAVKHFATVNGAIMAAAVADYRPAKQQVKKVKRSDDKISLEMVANPDIAAKLGTLKTKNQILAGFALETNDEEINAISKLKKKNLDFIVLNSLNDKGAGFQTDTNKITIIDAQNKRTVFQLKTKQEVAKDIVDYLIACGL